MPITETNMEIPMYVAAQAAIGWWYKVQAKALTAAQAGKLPASTDAYTPAEGLLVATQAGRYEPIHFHLRKDGEWIEIEVISGVLEPEPLEELGGKLQW